MLLGNFTTPTFPTTSRSSRCHSRYNKWKSKIVIVIYDWSTIHYFFRFRSYEKRECEAFDVFKWKFLRQDLSSKKKAWIRKEERKAEKWASGVVSLGYESRKSVHGRTVVIEIIPCTAFFVLNLFFPQATLKTGETVRIQRAKGYLITANDSSNKLSNSEGKHAWTTQTNSFFCLRHQIGLHIFLFSSRSFEIGSNYTYTLQSGPTHHGSNFCSNDDWEPIETSV